MEGSGERKESEVGQEGKEGGRGDEIGYVGW